MSDGSPALPPEVLQFLDEHIFSVTQLEVLLLVREADAEPRTARELGRQAYLSESAVSPWLEAFVERGLVERDEAGGYRAAPLDDEGEAVLEAVSNCYMRRRVTLSRHVYAVREDPARRFADAFRFRKDKDR